MIRYLDIYLVHGELLSGGLVLVARVLDDVVIEGVSGLHGRGRHVERSPPDFHLSNTFVRDGIIFSHGFICTWSSPCLAAVSALSRPVSPP